MREAAAALTTRFTHVSNVQLLPEPVMRIPVARTAGHIGERPPAVNRERRGLTTRDQRPLRPNCGRGRRRSRQRRVGARGDLPDSARSPRRGRTKAPRRACRATSLSNPPMLSIADSTIAPLGIGNEVGGSVGIAGRCLDAIPLDSAERTARSATAPSTNTPALRPFCGEGPAGQSEQAKGSSNRGHAAHQRRSHSVTRPG